MPLNLTNTVEDTVRVTETKQVKKIKITRMVMDLENSAMTIDFINIFDDGVGGDIEGKQTHSVSFIGQDYADVVTNNPTVYNDVKNTLYAEIMSKLGYTGTIE